MKINKKNDKQVKIKLNRLKKKFVLCLVLAIFKELVDQLNKVELAD